MYTYVYERIEDSSLISLMRVFLYFHVCLKQCMSTHVCDVSSEQVNFQAKPYLA